MGTIVNYDAVEKEHKIQYDNEEAAVDCVSLKAAVEGRSKETRYGIRGI